MPSRLLAGLLFATTLASVSFAQTPAPLDADAEGVKPVPDVAPAASVLVRKEAAEPARLTLSVPNVPGVYTLTITAAGRPTLAVQPEVIVLDPDGPVPGPLPPPGPSPLTDRAKAIKAAAEKATGDAKRLDTAQGLAVIYREIASNAKAPATPESVMSATLTMTDFVTAHQGSTPAWAPMREVLRGQLVDAIQRGNNGGPVTVEQLAALLNEAADGLEASVPKQAGEEVYKSPSGHSVQVSPDFWKFLMELFKMLLPLLLPLLGK